MSATSQTIAKQEGVPESLAIAALNDCNQDPVAARLRIRQGKQQRLLERIETAFSMTAAQSRDAAMSRHFGGGFDPDKHRELCVRTGCDPEEVARVLQALGNDFESAEQVLRAAVQMGSSPTAMLDGLVKAVQKRPELMLQTGVPARPFVEAKPLRDYRREMMGEWYEGSPVPARPVVDRERAMDAIEAADAEFGK